MTPEQEQTLQEHVQAIAKIFYENTPHPSFSPINNFSNIASLFLAIPSNMFKFSPFIGSYFLV
jgi:hypothetical protein